MKTKTKIYENNKILFVEDEKLNQIVIGTFLTEAGYEFDLAENGKTALQLVDKNRYQLILTDIGLPGMSGIDIATHIRQNNGISKDVPIIAITAHGADEVKIKCQQVGINGFANKPISRAGLCSLIHQHLQEV